MSTFGALWLQDPWYMVKGPLCMEECYGREGCMASKKSAEAFDMLWAYMQQSFWLPWSLPAAPEKEDIVVDDRAKRFPIPSSNRVRRL